LDGQSTTPEGIIRLEGTSPGAALALLEERQYLYRRLYLAPELRGLEALAKFVLITWLEWRVPETLDLSQGTCRGEDLRQQKADGASRLLWELSEQTEPPLELNGVLAMADELANSSYLDSSAIDWVRSIAEHLGRFKTEASERPSMSSARTSAEAVQIAHESPAKRAALTRPSSSFTCIRTRSPHSGLTSSAVAVAPGSSPRKRGRRQRSRIVSL